MANGYSSRWEYTVLEGMEHLTQGPAEQVLNTLGADGWELVSIDTSTAGHPRYVFKRPVTDAFVPEPELDPEHERWLRNVSIAEALLVLPEDERDELLCAVLTDEERECPSPPDDFYDRVMSYFAEKRERTSDEG